MSWKSDREDEFFYLKLVLAAAVVVLIVAGLIEWNARRQAAAMTRELLGRATAEELAKFRAMEVELASQEQAETKRLRRQPSRATRGDARPLASGERCIGGQRFRRLEDGWQEIGTCVSTPANKRAAYFSATADAIRRQWIQPENLPQQGKCPVRITQRPGGEVVAVEVLPACVYDEDGKRSVEDAIRKASPLPYATFEEVFMKTMTLRFRAENTSAEPQQ